MSEIVLDSLKKHRKEEQRKLANAFNDIGYESPIEILMSHIQTDFDNGVYKAVQSCGINVDKDELYKALFYDRNQYDKGFKDGRNAFAKELLEKIFPYDVVDKTEYAINAYAVYRAIIDLVGEEE